MKKKRVSKPAVHKGLKILTDKQRSKIASSIADRAHELNMDYVEYDQSYGGFIRIAKDEKTGVNDFQWLVDKHGQINIAATLPTNQLNAYDYLKDIKDYDIETKERKDIIGLARKAVMYEGVVATAIEALVEIPTLGGWFIYCKNPDLQKLCQYWAKYFGSMGEDGVYTDIDAVQEVSGIEQFAINVLWGLYQDGDWVGTEVWEKISVPQLKNKKMNLPTRYMEHDVAELTIDETLAKMGKQRIKAKIDSSIIDLVKSGAKTEEDKQKLKAIPKFYTDAIKKGKGEDVELPAEFTMHFSRKTSKRAAWGNPYVVKAFPALAYKHRLRALDNATIDGLIQRVWIVKIGHPDPESPLHVPDDERVLLAVSAFRRLRTQNVLIWGGSDLTTEEFGSSQGNILSFQDRYKSADSDTLMALGVPRLLMDGEGGNTNRDWSAFAKTISQMERFQIMLQRFIEHKLRQIAVENGFKDEFPKFFWMFLKMQDRDKAKNIITKLYEDNLIGTRMAINYSGFDSEMIIEDMQKEKTENLQDTLPVNKIPFTRPQNDGRPDDVKDGDGNPKSKTKPSTTDEKTKTKDK